MGLSFWTASRIFVDLSIISFAIFFTSKKIMVIIELAFRRCNKVSYSVRVLLNKENLKYFNLNFKKSINA